MAPASQALPKDPADTTSPEACSAVVLESVIAVSLFDGWLLRMRVDKRVGRSNSSTKSVLFGDSSFEPENNLGCGQPLAETQSRS